MVIYKTTNLLNGKFYIGRDLNNDPNYLGSGILLKRAIKKYGKENFKKEIIEECYNLDQLNEREIYWISELNAIEKGYNIALGGLGGDTISNHPNKKEITDRQSKSKKGKKLSESHKENISKSKKGKPGKSRIREEETRRKMSEAKLGKPLSESHKENLKIAAKTKKKPEPFVWSEDAKEKRREKYKNEIHPRSIQFEIIDQNGVVHIFNSARKAALYFACPINRILNNKLENHIINRIKK